MKAYYVNRLDRTDRHFLFRGAMAAAGFHQDDLIRVVAKNKEDYPTRERLCDAAADDGFPEFFNYQKHDGYPGYGHLICTWSVMRCWRMIAEQEDVAIQFLDDYYLRKSELELGTLIAPLTDLQILQLAWHERDDVWFLNAYDLPIQYKLEKLERSDKQPAVYKGAAQGCSDWANVLSPSGAQLLLDFMKLHPYVNTELTLTGLHHTFRQTEGIYSLADQNSKVNGTVVLRDNPWVGHLVEYTDGYHSDLQGTHEQTLSATEQT